MSGDSHIRCTSIAESLVAGDVGNTVITMQGYNEDILLWTVSTTVTRDEFSEVFSKDIYLSDDEIYEILENYTQNEIEGITFHIAEITGSHIVIRQDFDYSVIDIDELNRLWDVNNFESAVSLSSAIAELENRGAECAVVEIEDENDEDID